MKDRVTPHGIIDAKLFGSDGALKERRIVKNTVTDIGDAHVANRLADGANGTIAYMAVGTGTTTAAGGDTALISELDRNVLYSKAQGTGAVDNDVVYKGSWAAGDATGAIAEAGLFNAASTGTMLARQAFSVINKGAGDTLDITWTITYG